MRSIVAGRVLGRRVIYRGFPAPDATHGLPGCAFGRESPIPLLDPEIEAKIGMVNFRSITMRAFRLTMEDRCEDYGQVATYRGTIPDLPHAFVLDDHHRFETGRPMPVCGNTADMLAATRYSMHFELTPRRSHFGLFPCAPGSGVQSPALAACC